MGRKINRTKKHRLKELILGYSAHILDDHGRDTGKLRCIYTDRELVEIALNVLGRKYTERAVALSRSRQGIEPSTPHGGARPGAGRPKGSKNRTSSPKKKTIHKLTISDHALVQACPDAYEFQPGRWNQWTGKYEKLPRYVPRFRQDGLRTYTPVIPFPDMYSKGQKFSALKGQ